MTDCNEFSLNTKRYLSDFQEILKTMICGMTSARLGRSISYNFMVQMIPHHRAAIEMSKNLLQYTTCIPLQDIATGIISEQTKSIHDMENILCKCKRLTSASQQRSHYQRHMNMIMQEMFHQMETAVPDNDIDISFMREMIPHHKGAIAMSKTALEYPICMPLKPILESIITSQEKGVQEMEALLKSALF